MQEVQLSAEARTDLHTSKTNACRASGKIPAVVYGHGDSIAIAVSEREFMKAIHTPAGHNVIVGLGMGGAHVQTLIKEIQRNPLTGKIVHVDFQRISLEERVEVAVPIRFSGEALGVKEGGGVLEHLVREVKVRCAVTDIPQEIVVDVRALGIGNGIAARELPLPPNVELMMDPALMVVNVVSSTKEEAPAAAAATEATVGEPEVITKGKKEEEGAEGAKAEAPKTTSRGKE